MSSAFKKIVASVLLVGFGLSAFAESDIDFGIDVSVDRTHQEFEDDSANITTVDIAPHLQYGNWDFSIDAPWISADANYVNSQFPTRLVTACSNVSSYAAKYPNLAARVTSYCQKQGVVDENDKVKGMSDITAFAHYGLLLDDEGIWLLSAGIGYKFDNGDVEKNLGSDTRNTLFELGLGANYGKLSASLTGGYVLVDGDDELTESSYNYASLDVGVNPWNWLTIGCSLNYDQSYYIGTDDVTKTTAYVKLKPFKHVRLKIYGSDFGSAEGYPDREYGGSVSFVY
ncbi:MAG: hypothetical protein QM709_07135 [Spongiibacteraceae bacterium]